MVEHFLERIRLKRRELTCPPTVPLWASAAAWVPGYFVLQSKTHQVRTRSQVSGARVLGYVMLPPSTYRIPTSNRPTKLKVTSFTQACLSLCITCLTMEINSHGHTGGLFCLLTVTIMGMAQHGHVRGEGQGHACRVKIEGIEVSVFLGTFADFLCLWSFFFSFFPPVSVCRRQLGFV